MLRQQKGHRVIGVLFVGVASRDELLAARKMHAARGSAACEARRFRPHYPPKGEYPSNTHYLIRCLIPMANIPHKTNDRQSRLSLLLGVASRDEPLAARKVHAARGSAAAKPTLSPALSPERRMPFEHALPHSLLQHYGEYPSYNKHRKVGALLLGVAYRDELLAARKMHAARGSAAAKPTLSPALSPERGTSFEHALSYSLSQPYGEYPSYKRAPQSRCPFCWRIPSICPRRKQKSRSLYRFSEFYGKTKSNDRQN